MGPGPLGPFIWPRPGPIWAHSFGPIHLGPARAHLGSFQGIHLGSVGPGPIGPIHLGLVPGPFGPIHLGPGPLGPFGPMWIHHHITTALLNILILWSDNKIRRNKNAQGAMTPAPKSLARGGLFCCSALFLEAIFGLSCPGVFVPKKWFS